MENYSYPLVLHQWYEYVIINLHLRQNKYIEILKHLEKDIGKARLLEMLKRASYEENVKLGKRLSGRIPSLKVFADPFRDETSSLSKTIVREIVEDSDTVFETRVTEYGFYKSIIFKTDFRKQNACATIFGSSWTACS